MKYRQVPHLLVAALTLLILVFHFGCTQYDYSSPLPGIIDIRLHTISDTTQIDFSPLNNFVLRLTQVTAIRSDNARAEVFADLKAIGRTEESYNTLDSRAKDSTLVIGQGYLPPGDYVGIQMLIQPGGTVILDGYRDILVQRPDHFEPTLFFQKPFHINDSRTTHVVLTINLDSSLVKRADDYLFEPLYYISSIQYE